MNIGIIGSGAVGQTLAKGFFKHGYSTMIGTRDPQKMLEWSKGAGMGIAVGAFAQVAAFGEIIVLAVKGEHAIAALEMAGQANLSGKTIIDATNPIDGNRPPDKGVLSFTTSLDRSLMEGLQQAFPDAHFVKAFNSVGSALMVNPSFESKPTMFICGNSLTAKAQVSNILEQFGWGVSDMGGVEGARAIEPLCILWCIPGFLRNEWNHAFHLMTS